MLIHVYTYTCTYTYYDYVCMYIYIYIHMYVYVYTHNVHHLCVCILCIHIYIYNISLSLSIYMYMYTCMYRREGERERERERERCICVYVFRPARSNHKYDRSASQVIMRVAAPTRARPAAWKKAPRQPLAVRNATIWCAGVHCRVIVSWLCQLRGCLLMVMFCVMVCDIMYKCHGIWCYAMARTIPCGDTLCHIDTWLCVVARCFVRRQAGVCRVMLCRNVVQQWCATLHRRFKLPPGGARGDSSIDRPLVWWVRRRCDYRQTSGLTGLPGMSTIRVTSLADERCHQ